LLESLIALALKPQKPPTDSPDEPFFYQG